MPDKLVKILSSRLDRQRRLNKGFSAGTQKLQAKYHQYLRSLGQTVKGKNQAAVQKLIQQEINKSRKQGDFLEYILSY